MFDAMALSPVFSFEDSAQLPELLVQDLENPLLIWFLPERSCKLKGEKESISKLVSLIGI
jgi:hypothetical protein